MNKLIEQGIIGLDYLKLIYFILFTVGYNMYLEHYKSQPSGNSV